MPETPSFQSPNFHLHKMFGDTVQVRIVEVLLKLLLEQESHAEEKPLWMNISEIARAASSSKSAAKGVLDKYLAKDLVLEKEISTHAQNPPRYFQLNTKNKANRDLVFFYTKIRGNL
ncbi:MAG: hypothetical protein ACTSRK_14925 [Promethearchaeota archaeon]